jgi:hypothetical protein
LNAPALLAGMLKKKELSLKTNVFLANLTLTMTHSDSLDVNVVDLLPPLMVTLQPVSVSERIENLSRVWDLASVSAVSRPKIMDPTKTPLKIVNLNLRECALLSKM